MWGSYFAEETITFKGRMAGETAFHLGAPHIRPVVLDEKQPGLLPQAVNDAARDVCFNAGDLLLLHNSCVHAGDATQQRCFFCHCASIATFNLMHLTMLPRHIVLPIATHCSA